MTGIYRSGSIEDVTFILLFFSQLIYCTISHLSNNWVELNFRMMNKTQTNLVLYKPFLHNDNNNNDINNTNDNN